MLTSATIASDLLDSETLREYRTRTTPTPTPHHPARIACALVALVACLATALALAGSAMASTPRAVALSAATSSPTYLTYLYPHAHVTYSRGRDGHNCPRGGFFTDVSAYNWRGGALSPQRWDTIGLDYWRTPGGHRVTFDGITFTNESRRPVLVAGWCD